MEDRLLPPREAAKLLGVTVLTLKNWIRDGKLVAVKTPGGHRRYKLSDLNGIMKPCN